jgi:hypothetical protein
VDISVSLWDHPSLKLETLFGFLWIPLGELQSTISHCLRGGGEQMRPVCSVCLHSAFLIDQNN